MEGGSGDMACVDIKKIIEQDNMEQDAITFTNEEIILLKKSVPPRDRGIGKTLWSKAFTYYNQTHEVKLSPQCMPCYAKVLSFILIQRK